MAYNDNERLFDYLLSLGFQGDEMEERITKGINRSNPRFTVPHTVEHGRDTMLYNLFFEKDRQFEAYRFSGYRATHRLPVEIHHAEVAGLNTQNIESQMQAIDWHSWFASTREDHPQGQAIAEILYKLDRLTADPGYSGMVLAEHLKFKYWPTGSYESDYKDQLVQQYDTSQTFTASSAGLYPEQLAYHQLSGNLTHVHSKLSNMDLDAFTGMDLYEALEQVFSRNQFPAVAWVRANRPEGNIYYYIPIELKEGRPDVEHVYVEMRPHLPIMHGIYKGIDTLSLEREIAEIDWAKERITTPQYSEEEGGQHILLPDIEELLDKVLKVRSDPSGQDTANRLMLKYWSGVDALERYIHPWAWDELDGITPFTQYFPLTEKAETIFNLLSGRPVHDPTPDYDDQWRHLQPDGPKENGKYHVQVVSGPTPERLMEHLRLLPIRDSEEVLKSLLSGNRPMASLKTDKGSQKVLIEVTLGEPPLKLHTPDMRPVHFNFNLEADWNPRKEFMDKQAERGEEDESMSNEYRRGRN